MPRRIAPQPAEGGAHGTRAKIIDAAIRVLQDEGVAGVTTRRVASEAALNHGLVHYYFASIDSLMLEVVERIANMHIERHERRYTTGGDFFDAWRADMDELLSEDPLQGLTKIWFDAMAVVWNSPELTHRYGILHRARSRQVIKTAAERQLAECGLAADTSVDAEALGVLISVVKSGLSLDRLLGFEEGHQAAVDLLERLIKSALGSSKAASLEAKDAVATARGDRPPARAGRSEGNTRSRLTQKAAGEGTLDNRPDRH